MNQTGSTQQSGMALVSILWVLALLGLIAASVAVSSRLGTLDTRAAVDASQARWIADGGIERGLLDLLAGQGVGTQPLTGEPRLYRIGDATVSVRITDETGKADINVAPRELLVALIDSLEVKDDQGYALDADSIADAILDWRDRNDTARPLGAEASRYREEGRPQLPRDGPFPTLAELANVRGLTPTLAEYLKPFFTTASRSRAINPAHAPAEVLYALPGALKTDVDRLLAARAAGARLPRLPGADLWLTTRTGPGFLIVATAQLPEGIRFRREVLVWIEGYGIDTPIPFVLERRPGIWLDTL